MLNGAVDLKQVKNWEVNSILNGAQGLPVGPRPDVALTTTNYKNPNTPLILIIGAVALVLVWHAFRPKRGR